MPEPNRAGWTKLGALLPRHVRERVFEPALADLRRSWLTDSRSRRIPFPVQAVGTFCWCIVPALTGVFVRAGRPTRLTRACVWILLLIVGAGIVFARLRGSYS